jgi:hypothetical protein
VPAFVKLFLGDGATSATDLAGVSGVYKQPMYPELWITFHQEVYLIELNVQAQYLCLMLGAHLMNDLGQSLDNLSH